MITCAGNPKLEHIHRKSVPLMLDWEDQNLIDMWLDPTLTDSEALRHLLTPKINMNLIATPITGARDLTPRADQIEVTADE